MAYLRDTLDIMTCAAHWCSWASGEQATEIHRVWALGSTAAASERARRKTVSVKVNYNLVAAEYVCAQV